MRFLLAAGGTGGHIFPAVAFGQWLSQKHGADITYLCGSRDVELSIYRGVDIEPRVLEISGSPLGISGIMPKLKRVKELAASYRDAARIIDQLHPDACISFGGYASAPMLLAAKRRGIKTIAHEQNASAGIMTKAAAKIGIPIAAGWKVCRGVSDFTYTGVPVRQMRKMSRDEAWGELEMPCDRPAGIVVVAMSGSLGSSGLSKTIMQAADDEQLNNFTFLMLDPKISSATKCGSRAYQIPQRWDIAPVFSVADIVITRCGASTLSEVAAADIPCVAAPWRGAARDHQMHNAIEFANAPHRIIWNEKKDDVEDMTLKLKELEKYLSNSEKHNGSKLYYNEDETVCERLISMIEL